MPNSFTPAEISQILEAFFDAVGTRQYIGARYVPIFGRKGEESIVWDNTAPYEPLTIVLYQGNSFTSRQYVPEGVEITNEEFWAETGNYNAQIEQYRQDVIDLTESLNEFRADVNERISNSRKGFEVGWLSDTTGTCVICKGDTGIICLDIGSTDGNVALFEQQLSDFLGDRKIDAIVISHYHDDHSTGFSSVKKFAKDDCVVYEQMNPSQANTQYQQYLTNRANIITTFGADNVIVPNNNEVISIGDLSLRMVNTDANNIAAYNNVYGETDRNANGLNVFSIISFVSKNGNTLCFTGDAEGITQRLMTQYAEPCTIVSTPHHGVNYLGYSEFFDKCCPQMFLYTKRNTIAYNTIPIQSFTDRFAGKYSVENNIPFLNGGSKAIFELSDYNVYLKDGVICSATDGSLGYANSPMEMLTTSYYNDNPHVLLEMTGEDFLNACRQYNMNKSCTFTNSYQIFNAKPQFVTDIMDFLGITDTGTPIRITPFGSALFIGNPSVYNGSKMAMMAGSANLSANSTTVTKINGISTLTKEVTLDTGVLSHTITDQLILNALSNGNDNVYVEVSTTTDVSTRFRVYLKPISNRFAEYRGVLPDRSLSRIFSAVINNNEATAHVYNISGGTTVDGYVCGYGIGF